jgi:uncharacterized protein YebE (UPF0316 family)
MNPVLAGLFVFAMHVTDISLDTLRQLALGHIMFRVYSLAYGTVIAQTLRAAGYAVTEFMAHSRDGRIAVVNSVVARKDTQAVQSVIEQIDPQAFVTVDEVRPLRRGYFGQARFARTVAFNCAWASNSAHAEIAGEVSVGQAQ